MNKDALAEIFDLYAPALYRYAMCLCNDSLMADFIVGDVFAKLVDQLFLGRGPESNLRSYLFEATYHTLIDEARHGTRTGPLDAVDSDHQDQTHTEQQYEKQILYEKVLQVIREDLTNDQRHVIFLRFIEGFSIKETAAIVGKEINNVKVTQNRAIGNIRKAVFADG